MNFTLQTKFDDYNVRMAGYGNPNSRSRKRAIAQMRKTISLNFYGCSALFDCSVDLLEKWISATEKSIQNENQKGKEYMTERPGACAERINKWRILDAWREWTKINNLFPIGIPGAIHFDENGNEVDKSNNVFDIHALETYDRNSKDLELAEEQDPFLIAVSVLLENAPKLFENGKVALDIWIRGFLQNPRYSYREVADAMGMDGTDKKHLSRVKNFIFKIRNEYLIPELTKQGWTEDHLKRILP